MLEVYLTSILIFMIINLSAVAFFRDYYIKNGWVVGPHKQWYKRIYNAFLLSAIPVLRVFLTILLICMAIIKKEDLEKFVEENENDN
jgi:hypothetical protein